MTSSNFSGHNKSTKHKLKNGKEKELEREEESKNHQAINYYHFRLMIFRKGTHIDEFKCITFWWWCVFKIYYPIQNLYIKVSSGLEFYWTQNYRQIHTFTSTISFSPAIVPEPFAHSLKRNDGSQDIQYNCVCMCKCMLCSIILEATCHFTLYPFITSTMTSDWINHHHYI